MFLMCSFICITVTEICFGSVLSMVNTMFLYLCVVFQRNISEGRGKKTLTLCHFHWGELVLVLNHLVLWFKEKNWITVKIWFLTNCRRCFLMLVGKEILKTTVTDGLPQRLQRWLAGGAASYISVTNSHSCKQSRKLHYRIWSSLHRFPLCCFVKCKVWKYFWNVFFVTISVQENVFWIARETMYKIWTTSLYTSKKVLVHEI